MANLRIIPLGGMGNVTKNMFVYEYGDEMLIVDCGIGFPEISMHGVDLLIPDGTYVKEQLENGKRIVGMLFTHGHDDHIAAAGYILPDLPEDFALYASPLTAAFAEQRLIDHHIERGIQVIKDEVPIKLGVFEVEALPMTHSVPDTKHYLIKTPEGNFYHGSDFKLDKNPIDDVVPDYDRLGQIGKDGLECLLIDCLRIENKERTKSESTVQSALAREMENVKGKVVVTLMSSHIHRIQQVVNVAVEQGRKICFIGRSVEQNIESALNLHKLKLDRSLIIDKRDLDQYTDEELCLVVAGSQGQEGSSLIRAIMGEHQMFQIGMFDKVIFSADVIPGNEQNFYGAIDELAKNNVDVVYPDIAHDLHVSGHASAPEQAELIQLLRPKYLMPVGGAYRHRKLFHDLAKDLGYDDQHVLLPDNGEVVAFDHGNYVPAETIYLKELMVDGKGVGDVGTVVLADRKAMAQDGMIVLVIPKKDGVIDMKNLTIVSRGFIYMRQGEEFIAEIKKRAVEILLEMQKAGEKEDQIRRKLERRLARRIDKMIGRSPLILPVFMKLD